MFSHAIVCTVTDHPRGSAYRGDYVFIFTRATPDAEPRHVDSIGPCCPEQAVRIAASYNDPQPNTRREIDDRPTNRP